MPNIRKKKLKEWNKDPHCRYCGVETVLEVKKGEDMDYLATIDHVYSRLSDKRRSENNHREKRRILVCFKCNQYRNDLEISKLPIEELWRRAGHYDQKTQNSVDQSPQQ